MNNEPSFYKLKKERLERIKNIYNSTVNKINEATYIDKTDGLELARYLVSNIEKEEYCISEIPVKYFKLPEESKSINYKLVYLIKKDKKKKVEEILSNKFIFNSSQSIIKFIMDLPCNDYILLTYYKDTDIPRIYFSNDNKLNLTFESSSEINSYISDSRYQYIIDFMNKVVESKLNNFCYNINNKKLYKMADEFIDDYRNKSKILNMKQNNF